MTTTQPHPTQQQRVDAVIVGAGLGGLATAARLATAGLRVMLCERAGEAGGRGRTLVREGFSLNLGAHALYVGGDAMALLRSLDVAPRGRAPSGRGGLLRHGREHALPGSPLSMLTSTALTLRSKFELLRFFARLPRMSGLGLGERSCGDWLAEQFPDREELRAFVAGIVRLASYCGEPEALSADAALAQLQGALAGVLYLDGGWAQLVEALVERCLAAGVDLRLRTRVGAIARADTARWAVEVDGRSVACEHIIVAGSPTLADALYGPLLGRRFAGGTSPITAACLDLGLRGEWPGPSFVLDLDEPIYLSVHSRVAELAPAGHTLVSLAWYRRACDADTPAAELRARLERMVRRWMPDYEAALVVDQFLPAMVVAHDRPQPSRGGFSGRTPAHVGEGLYLVGDWVGEHGQLLDAALASATTVCAAVLPDSPARVRMARQVIDDDATIR
jgi:phytoene dehydrogenase-like protein